jgi:L-asparaginase / beta-aspartyl-peptidase
MGADPRRPLIALHGGAGMASRADLGPDDALARIEVIEAAMSAGMKLLASGKGSLEAVIAAVEVMEESGKLNAGRGATVTESGTVQLSASVADGSSGAFGGVALTNLRNPVRFAARLMSDGRHAFMAGDAADSLGRQWGLELASSTPSRVVKERLDDSVGTVGGVAIDLHGSLAAATSTGGIRGQRVGRIGDSPVCGAGTWADNATCAVSATGEGEAFIRASFAHDVHARMLYGGEPLARACELALESVRRHGGRGGCVAIDGGGALSMPFTTRAMLRGWLSADGRRASGIDPGECDEPDAGGIAPG